MKKTLHKYLSKLQLFSILLLSAFMLSGCGENLTIVNKIDERDANEILVFLASQGISGEKMPSGDADAAGAGDADQMWNIVVDKDQSLDAMSLLNRNGLPRKKGVSLLTLFSAKGLMTSNKEETIRYQAGLQEELKNTIRKIDGVLDSEVQITFPTSEGLIPGQNKPKAKAAIYVKHQGVMDDPNVHLESKIKRLVAGSVDGLDYDSVSVISDRARIADIDLMAAEQILSSTGKEKEYVSVWSMTMSKKSLAKFRMVFGLMIFFILLFGGAIGYMVYRYLPILQKKKVKEEHKSEE